MSKVIEFVSRYGPLVAAFLVGTAGLVAAFAPTATPFVDGFLAFLGFFGAAPDAAIADAVGTAVASALLVYGAIRKAINLVRDYLNPDVV